MDFFATKITIPKNKDDCTEMNPVTLNLEKWAKRLEKLGIIICVIISIYGIVMAFFNQNASVEAYNLTARYSDRMSFDFGTFITTLLQYAFYAFITYCSCHATALIISAVGMITYNTMVTAKTNLLMMQNNITNDTGKVNTFMISDEKQVSDSTVLNDTFLNQETNDNSDNVSQSNQETTDNDKSFKKSILLSVIAISASVILILVLVLLANK